VTTTEVVPAPTQTTPAASPIPTAGSTPAPAATFNQPAAATQASPFKKFTLQVGAFSTSANAAKQKSFFEKNGYPVETGNKVLDDKTLFIVRVGSYATEEEAKKAGADIRKKFSISSMVVER
jgi:septal ring-binding cell division protein DamX